jgi:MFS family permease
MMTKFLIQSHGFNLAARYVAIVVCLTAALAVIIARPNPAHQIRKPDTWFKLSIFWDTHAFQNRAYSFLVASIAFLFFGFYAVFFNLEEWAVNEGFGYRKAINTGLNAGIEAKPARNSIETFWLLSIMNASSTIGRLGSAYLCDHFGALNVHATVTAVASILVLALWTLASNLSSAVAFVVIFGAFSGAVIGLPPASVAYILGPTPEAQAKLGQWTGMMYSCAAVFALTGPVIAGHLITEYSTFLTVQLWSGACMAMSATCMGGAIWCRRKEEKTRQRKESQAPILDAEKGPSE